MEATQTTATFESVWATLQELSKSIKESVTNQREELAESRKEIQRELAESHKETQRELTESRKETDKKFQELAEMGKEVDRRISRLGNRIGELIEHFAAPNLLEKLEEFGYEFTRISRNHIIKNKRKEHVAEIDILLENGDYAMAIEVKSLLNKNDVIEHQQRMKIIREYADKHKDKRKFIAAIAVANSDNKAKEYALENGFFFIEQTGDTVRIKAPQKLTYW